VKGKTVYSAAQGGPSKSGAGVKLALAFVALASLCVCAVCQEDSADYWYNKSGELFFNGSSEEAVQALNKALQIEPENATIWLTKGSLLELIGEKDEALVAHQNALDLFNQTIENNPEDAEAFWLKAKTFRWMNRLDLFVRL